MSSSTLKIPILLNFSRLFHSIFLKPYDFSDSKLEKTKTHVLAELGLSSLFFSKQVHGNKIYHLKTQNPSKVPEADILITQNKGVGLGIRHADCQAAIFYDPISSTLAMAHCGWKGHTLGVYSKCVEYLTQMGVNPEHLVVGISPSLGPCHAEFINYQQEFPQKLWKYRDESLHFDLWSMAKETLKSLGINEKKIEILNTCTYEYNQTFYSYRRDRCIQRHATIAALRN